MNTGINERTWLEWLVKVRIIIITFLLVIELAITTLTETQVSVRLFVSIILAWYVVSSVHVAVLYYRRDWESHAKYQIITDLIFATGIIYSSGGIDTTFNFLFPLIIIMASILLSPSWAYYTASISFILLGGTLELSYFGYIHSYSASHPDLKSLQAVIFINGFAYLIITYLANRLSNRLRQAGVELADKTFALEDLQAVHKNIIDSISAGLITTDLSGEIKYINHAGLELLGKEELDCIGARIHDLFVGQLPIPSGLHVEQEVAGKSSTARGKLFRVAVTELQVAERGVIGYVYRVDDLTEIRRVEREIQTRDRLAAIGRLASGIAHEIRNPLSSIAGSVQFLSRISTLNNDQKTLVDIVNRESERLNSIITDFLAYSREKSYRMVPVDLRVLVEETLTLLENSPERIEIVREFESDAAFTIGDSDKLKQVFWNICDNAIRAMRPNQDSGKPSRLVVRLRSTGANWRIGFADTGTGLTPQQLEKIFEPFQSSFEGGSGLGLAIVYQIIQAHEGTVTAASTPGRGAEFTIILKKIDKPAVIAATLAASSFEIQERED